MAYASSKGLVWREAKATEQETKRTKDTWEKQHALCRRKGETSTQSPPCIKLLACRMPTLFHPDARIWSRPSLTNLFVHCVVLRGATGTCLDQTSTMRSATAPSFPGSMKKKIALNSWMRSLSFTRKIWIFNFHLHVHHQLSITNCHVCSGHLWKTANRQCRLRITAWPMQSPGEKPTGLVARGRWGRPLPRSVFKTKYSKQWLSLHKHSINSSIRIQVSFQLQGRKTIWFVGKTWTNYRKDILHRKTKLYWIVFGGSFLVFCLVCCCFCLLFIPHVQLARCFAADFIENSLV